MNKKILMLGEFCGVFLISFAASLSGEIYEAADGNVLGVLFGAVNGSVWERSKLVALLYIAYGAFELILLKPDVKRFVLGKAVGVYALLGSLTALYMLVGVENFSVFLTLTASVSGFLISCALTMRPADVGLFFLPSALALLFMVIMLFCFTVAPLHTAIFVDPVTGLYGVIPPHIDVGSYLL